MNKSITQDIQNDKQISKSINRFFKRFRVASLLKLANASKSKGFAAVDIFQFLFLLIFTNRSMYMNLLMGKNLPAFAQDTAYRFMKMSHINWVRFTTLLATVISKEAIEPLTSDERMNVLIIDDSLIERNRSKKVELLTKVFLHSLRYKFSWNRYGVCSYDCGPSAIGKKGFVPYKEAARKILEYFNENADLLPELETLNQKRDFAATSLKELYDFQILYHRQPLGFYLHDSFEKNKESLRKKIIHVENGIGC
jgi:hypothetical protein